MVKKIRQADKPTDWLIKINLDPEKIHLFQNNKTLRFENIIPEGRLARCSKINYAENIWEDETSTNWIR